MENGNNAVNQSGAERGGQGSGARPDNLGNAPASQNSHHISRTETSSPGAGEQVNPSPSAPSHVADIPSQPVLSTQDLSSRGVYSPSRVPMRHDNIPDLLHSHIIPAQPSPPLREPDHLSVYNGGGSGGGHGSSPDTVVPPPHHQVYRHHPRPNNRDRRRTRRSRGRRRSRSTSQSEDEFCKHGCLKCMAATTSFRWILVILSLLGVCCVVTGIVLAALHATGQSFLFLAIMFIGLGVLLVVVVAVGWRCTPRGHEPLHALFGIGDFRQPQERRSRPRHHGRRSRDSHWYGGMMYPEFQYRRPPPSYNASMQDFQHQLVIAQTQRERFHSTEELPAEDYSLPSSPPPSYRSRASTVRTGIQITFPPMQGDNSHPPTYRSHVSTMGHHTHSRPSLPTDGFSTQQNGSSGNNTRAHSRNNSASNFRVHSRSGSNVGGVSNGHSRTHSRSNSAGPVTVPSDGGVLAAPSPGTTVPTAGGGAVATTAPVGGSSQEDLLVQQTLQTLEDATASAGVDNLANDTQVNEDDDEYPMETPL